MTLSDASFDVLHEIAKHLDLTGYLALSATCRTLRYVLTDPDCAMAFFIRQLENAARQGDEDIRHRCTMELRLRGMNQGWYLARVRQIADPHYQRTRRDEHFIRAFSQLCVLTPPDDMRLFDYARRKAFRYKRAIQIAFWYSGYWNAATILLTPNEFYATRVVAALLRRGLPCEMIDWALDHDIRYNPSNCLCWWSESDSDLADYALKQVWKCNCKVNRTSDAPKWLFRKLVDIGMVDLARRVADAHGMNDGRWCTIYYSHEVEYSPDGYVALRQGLPPIGNQGLIRNLGKNINPFLYERAICIPTFYELLYSYESDALKKLLTHNIMQYELIDHAIEHGRVQTAAIVFSEVFDPRVLNYFIFNATSDFAASLVIILNHTALLKVKTKIEAELCFVPLPFYILLCLVLMLPFIGFLELEIACWCSCVWAYYGIRILTNEIPIEQTREQVVDYIQSLCRASCCVRTRRFRLRHSY